MITRNGGRSVVGIIVRLIPSMQGRLSRSLIHSVKLLLIKISRIATSQGKIGLVLYLKTCSVLLQQSIMGYRVNTITPRVSRTRSGVPRVIPAS